MHTELVYLLNGPMGDAGMGRMMRGGGFFLGGLMTVIWTALLVLLVLWLVRNWSSISSVAHRSVASAQAGGATAASAVQTPLEIVQSRYARGEITREEYETIRRDLAGEAPPAQPAPQ
jgi:putative membrane protein